jgi:hypothetical protein
MAKLKVHGHKTVFLNSYPAVLLRIQMPHFTIVAVRAAEQK